MHHRSDFYSGPIPVALGALKRLEVLDLAGNKLTGKREWREQRMILLRMCLSRALGSVKATYASRPNDSPPAYCSSIVFSFLHVF